MKNSIKDKIENACEAIIKNWISILCFIAFLGSICSIYLVRHYTRATFIIILMAISGVANLYILFKYSSLLTEMSYSKNRKPYEIYLKLSKFTSYSFDGFASQAIEEKGKSLLSDYISNDIKTATKEFLENDSINSIYTLCIFKEQILENYEKYKDREVTLKGFVTAPIYSLVTVTPFPVIFDDSLTVKVNDKEYFSNNFKIEIYNKDCIEIAEKGNQTYELLSAKYPITYSQHIEIIGHLCKYTDLDNRVKLSVCNYTIKELR